MSAIQYLYPESWVLFDYASIAAGLAEAKALILSLKTIPHQKTWFDKLQKMELKREVAGTSRIEGAVFTERELDAAMKETPEQLYTRSQKQAHAAVQAYRWIETIPTDRPIDKELVLEIHRLIITGADDDRCPPGKLRQRDQNVTFGAPRHRGVDGGEECERLFESLINSIQKEFKEHDPLIQALAAHYHLAAMHPFTDGNGRTARALSALMLQRAGLKGTCFIALSNYYDDQKAEYLNALNTVRSSNHDLTPFLRFGLQGVVSQATRLLAEIQEHVSKALFLNVMYEMMNRLKSPRKAALAKRQMKILQFLLESSPMSVDEVIDKMYYLYGALKKSGNAFSRDFFALSQMGAIQTYQEDDTWMVKVRLEWPTEITETEVFNKMKKMPHLKSLSFLHPEVEGPHLPISV